MTSTTRDLLRKTLMQRCLHWLFTPKGCHAKNQGRSLGPTSQLPTLPIHASAWLFLCLLAAELPGCDQPFNPRAPFERKLVIFSVLATNRSEQFVRVSTNYDVPGFDPNENTTDPAMNDATVSVLSEGKTYTLRDTVLPRPDNERYKTPIICYVARPLDVTCGRAYELQVVSPTLGIARASLMVPEHCYVALRIDGAMYLDYVPAIPPGIKDPGITVEGNFSKWAAGYVLRFFLKYEVLKDTVWVAEELEVPAVHWADSVAGIQLRYPTVDRVQGSRYTVVFMVNAYRWALRDIVNRYIANRVVFREARFQMTQLDGNLYKYYKTVNAFEDKGTIRLDQPDYSNINGGVGVFGAYAVDSLVHTFPPDFPIFR